eukprot:TRINITY_DN33994_c0_g1_i1.p1 TRINITY_DN33994_c0_g1~~TRINITY_DN33994_c0_g1_i1.p1  ORF type:complete len:292 (+),score=68.52 TRINITY_DN33994_c0_g1_i1:75-878(+)
MDGLAAAMQRLGVVDSVGDLREHDGRRSGVAPGRCRIGRRPPPNVRSSPYNTDRSVTGLDGLLAAFDALAISGCAGGGCCAHGCGRAPATAAGLRSALLNRVPAQFLDSLEQSLRGVEESKRDSRSVPWLVSMETAFPNSLPRVSFAAPNPKNPDAKAAEVFTLSVEEGNPFCDERTATILECRFKVYWEFAHLMSLGGPAAPAHRARLPFTQRLVSRVATALRRCCSGAPPGDLALPRRSHRHLQRTVYLLGPASTTPRNGDEDMS